jgi:hypothetical protein
VDFAWFPKAFPKGLLVACQGQFSSTQVRGITIDPILLSNGLPHPHPGRTTSLDAIPGL